MTQRDKRHLDDGFLAATVAGRSALEKLGWHVQLVVGVPARKVGGETLRKLPPDFEVVDTQEDAAYEACLASLDILVCDFSRDGYFYRSSGVVCDAICSGVWVVCPDYPVLKHQVSWPVEVGVVYPSWERIPDAMAAAGCQLTERGADPHWEWTEARRASRVDAALRARLR
jgi:hypothetical protein